MMHKKEIFFGEKTLSIETGKVAKQANGATMVQYGDTVVLATAVASKKAKEDIDFFPLSVEYRKKYLIEEEIECPNPDCAYRVKIGWKECPGCGQILRS